jgi:hypothetical protein
MDDQAFSEALKDVFEDEAVIQVDITVKHASMILSAIQLATNHPEMSQSVKQVLTGIAYTFQDAVIAVHPEAKEALLDSWNEDGIMIEEGDDEEDMLDLDPPWFSDDDIEEEELPFDDAYLEDEDDE